MLTKEEINQYLKEIDSHMNELGISGEIVLCGGAVMTLVYEARPSTKDIDALFVPTGPINDIVKKISKRDNLEADWLNDAAKGFIDTSRMNFETIRQFENLIVKMPSAQSMLAMKLTSARLVGKDKDDALFLMRVLDIQTEEELFNIIEQNVSPQRKTPMAHFFTQELFHQYQSALFKSES